MLLNEYNHTVKEYADNLYRFVLMNIKNKEDARDIVQDTFEKLWINRDNIDLAKVKSWLFTTAYRVMIDKIRKLKREGDIENAPEPVVLDRTQSNIGLSEALNIALDTLPEIQKSVVLLRDYEEYEYKEIGEITGLNESQVKVYIYRARVALKNYLVSPDLLI
jgi:RNA polymerase sigma-70 factor (ECF subfamily)